jgi:hypothetical protein
MLYCVTINYEDCVVKGGPCVVVKGRPCVVVKGGPCVVFLHCTDAQRDV